jgi:hypothetical protein
VIQQIIGLWIFSMLVHLLGWNSEKAATRENIRRHYHIVITEECVTRYQVLGLLVQTSSVTMLCMPIAELFYRLTGP